MAIKSQMNINTGNCHRRSTYRSGMNVNLEYNGHDGISVKVYMCLGERGIDMLMDLMKTVKQEKTTRGVEGDCIRAYRQIKWRHPGSSIAVTQFEEKCIIIRVNKTACCLVDSMLD